MYEELKPPPGAVIVQFYDRTKAEVRLNQCRGRVLFVGAGVNFLEPGDECLCYEHFAHAIRHERRLLHQMRADAVLARIEPPKPRAKRPVEEVPLSDRRGPGPPEGMVRARDWRRACEAMPIPQGAIDATLNPPGDSAASNRGSPDEPHGAVLAARQQTTSERPPDTQRTPPGVQGKGQWT